MKHACKIFNYDPLLIEIISCNKNLVLSPPRADNCRLAIGRTEYFILQFVFTPVFQESGNGLVSTARSKPIGGFLGRGILLVCNQSRARNSSSATSWSLLRNGIFSNILHTGKTVET
jgi:hypothetical protein